MMLCSIQIGVFPPHIGKGGYSISSIYRGVGTGETGEARASPEIRGCLKSNSKIGKKRNMSGILFFSASPEIILFLRPWR